MIVPVQAPLVGDHVFYVQEMAADDPRRVLAQRLYVVKACRSREQAVLTQLDFNEPARWRDGHLRRDLFRSLLMQDLRAACRLRPAVERKATTGLQAPGGTHSSQAPGVPAAPRRAAPARR